MVACRFGLGCLLIVFTKKNLSLKIRGVDGIVVDDADLTAEFR